jgi:hypothetical protein
MQIDWLTIALSGLVSVVLAVLVVWLHKMAQRPPRPIVVRDGSVVGEYMEKYCQHTGLAIDKIVLVGYQVDERETVYRIESVDMYPEVWLGDE